MNKAVLMKWMTRYWYNEQSLTPHCHREWYSTNAENDTSTDEVKDKSTDKGNDTVLMQWIKQYWWREWYCTDAAN